MATLLQAFTEWGELFELDIPPPKPGLELTRMDHRVLFQRCAWHECNEPFPICERDNKIFHSEECREANKAYIRKLIRSGIDL